MQTTTFADLTLSRMTLGTVQLGLSYGIANTQGQPDYDTALRILAAAYEGGVNCLDTAAIYGTSEETIGKALAELGLADKVTIATKVTQMADGLTASEADEIVEGSVTQSLKRLNLDVLPICLFHIENNFLDYADSLLKMKDRGLVKHAGSSTNLPEPTATVIRSGKAEAIQIPSGVLDHRFLRQGLIKEAGERGMAVFVRSIYLQGLLLMPEENILPELEVVKPIRRKLASIASEAGMSLPELAVRFLLGTNEVTSLVVGSETVDQVKENTKLFENGPLSADLCKAVSDAVPDLPETILFPKHWSKRMESPKLAGK